MQLEKILEGLSQVVRLRRIDLSLSQEDLALRSGLTRTYVNVIESGRAKGLTIAKLVDICNALDVTPAELLTAAEAITS